ASSGRKLQKEIRQRIKLVQRDATFLSDHATFLSNKINFLLDATLGLINLEQNQIIKIFSVAAVVFLPPTLVASIYGMNFDAMPELKWLLGYPFALGLMVLSAVVPYLFFKRRGWL
ncbi:MAG: magnesium transporter, partial [Mesorhizobium sp.]